MTAVAAPRPPTAAERSKLSMLREVFMHSPGHQDWLETWWRGLAVTDRRLLLAFVGLDDSEEAAARPWPQLLEEHRDSLLHECKRLARLLSVLRFA